MNHGGASATTFEEEEEEEMIKIVNPNKHQQNQEDGGRTRKLRHVSRTEHFKNGRDMILSLSKDLFNVKQATQ